jgi:uncharacterized membrane protein
MQPSSEPLTLASSPSPRYQRLDALRGAAIVWMAAYHFCFDLSHFHFTKANFYEDAFWLNQRTGIVSLFLLCAGLGQAVALAQALPWARFGRRWAQVAGCALLVSLGSRLMFPDSYISFGVLHGLALMLLLLRLLAPRLPFLPFWILLGALAWSAPHLWQHTWFDSRWTDWIGLVTYKPITEDYVPLLPWFGMVCWGYALGRWLLARRPAWLSGPLPGVARPLALLGRWSLSFYMLHQPVLIGAVLLAQATIRP